MKLVGYIRVSTNSQAENTSFPEQREKKAKVSGGGYAYGYPQFGRRSVGSELVAHDDELETIKIIRRHRRSGKSYQSFSLLYRR